MMAAVVRLKRRLSEEPLNALIINCKRRKTEDNIENEDKQVSALLKFVGTVNNQEEDLAKHILKPTKLDLEERFKKHTPDINSKLRQETKESSINNRFKIVNLFRSQDTKVESSNELEEKIELTVVDVETDGDKKNEAANGEYVYDLYYTNSEGFCESELNNVLSICAADELVYGSYRDNGRLSDDSEHESDDSNEENNWRNDYPDEEDAEDSIDEDDMRNAVNRMTFKDELSDDDGEEGFVYSIDSEEAGFEEELDHSDVRRYGELYARFKARQKKEEEKYNKDIYHEELDTDNEFSD